MKILISCNRNKRGIRLFMAVIFFVLWIIFNGQITTEIIWFGVGISAVLYWFVCRYMGYSPKKDLKACRLVFHALGYVVILLWEVVKANAQVIHLILSSKYEAEPKLVTFQTDLKTVPAKVVLANSITLTPGTITVSLEDNSYQVHCLDKEMAEGMEDSVFVHLLKKMEEK